MLPGVLAGAARTLRARRGAGSTRIIEDRLPEAARGTRRFLAWGIHLACVAIVYASGAGRALADGAPDPGAGDTRSAEVGEERAGGPPPGNGTEGEVPVPGALDGPKEVLDANSVFKLLGPEAPPAGALLPRDPLYRSWRRLDEGLYRRLRLRLGLAYTVLGQWAPNAPGGREAMGGDLDLFGTWNLLGSEARKNAGYLGFAAEWRHALGPLPPALLAGEFDGFLRTAQAFDEQDFSLVELWWTQELLGDRLEITAGRVSPRSFYDTNRLRNQNVAFLNQAFAGNRAVGLPGRGFGLNAIYRPQADWYATAGVHDANGTTTVWDPNELANGQFAYVGELGWTPTFERARLGRGNYRLTLWYSDPSRERGTDAGRGFALSLDQEVCGRAIAFLRYAFADGDARGARQTLSGGVGLTFAGRPEDLLGFGVGWSEPVPSVVHEEFVAELFYRLQLTPTQQLTAGWQSYVEPAFSSRDEVVNVLGVRWRIRY